MSAAMVGCQVGWHDVTYDATILPVGWQNVRWDVSMLGVMVACHV